jgi:hypothetical protein
LQEEEEQWISGEELYTEGSSDEDDTPVRRKRHIGGRAWKHRQVTSGKEARHYKSNTVPSSVGSSRELGMIAPEVKPEPEEYHRSQSQQVNLSVTDSDEQTEISWRPKRGSIKLPNLSPEGRGEMLTATDVGIH